MMAEGLASSGGSEIQYGGFFRRGAALIIDLLLFIVPSVLVNIGAFEIAKSISASGEEWTLLSYFKAQIPYHILIIVSLSSQFVWCMVVAWFLSKYRWQATPGKRLMKVYVVGENGNKISYKHAFVRTLLPILIIISLNFVNLAFINKKIERTDESYERILKEFVPSLEQEVVKSGKTFKDFMDTFEGKEFSSQEMNKLSLERKTQFMEKVQLLQTQGQQGELLINLLPLLFLGILVLWYFTAIFTKEKTTLHDIIAKTRVIRGQL